MEIETSDLALPFDLRETAPDGVSVIFANPKMTRSLESEMPLILVTLHFAVTVDVAAVAAWLFDKLNGAKGTKTTHNRIDVKINRKEFRLIIERETHSKDR